MCQERLPLRAPRHEFRCLSLQLFHIPDVFRFGFTVLTSFSSEQTRKTGVMVMPQPGDKVRGGHAVTAVGFDDFKQVFIVRNSWGEGWGDKGYFYMPYEYITNPDLAHDFWCINFIEGIKDAGPKK